MTHTHFWEHSTRAASILSSVHIACTGTIIEFHCPILDTWIALGLHNAIVGPPTLFVVQIPAFYQQPPGPGVVPWPQATSPGYFEAAAAVSAGGNFVHFVNNPPQQAFAGKVEPERD